MNSFVQLQPHQVLYFVLRDGGYTVTLDCLHEVWSAVQPGETMYCGRCATQFIRTHCTAVPAEKEC